MQSQISFTTAYLAAYVLFFATLFMSIVVYRLSPFHPLAKYHGPIACKISQLWAVVIYSRGKAHHNRKLLHDQHGPVIRIGSLPHVYQSASAVGGQGPNELSVTQKDVLPYILGSQGMPKGPLFEGGNHFNQRQEHATSQPDHYPRLVAPCAITEGLEQSFFQLCSQGLGGTDTFA